MGEKDIVREILKGAEKTLKTPSLSPEGIKCCDRFPSTVYNDYLDLRLEGEEKAIFEAHYPECLYCLSRLMLALVGDKKALLSPLLSEAGQKISLEKTMGLLKEMEGKREKPLLLAAAEKQETKTGRAYGIALDRETGRGVILECMAIVGEEKEGGSLRIRGKVVEEIEERGRRIKGTSPLRLMEENLSTLFQTHPFLNAWRLHKRDIIVQINLPGEGYLMEAESLTLAVLMSILYALLDKEADQRVFSADLDLRGELRPVGEIGSKLQLAAEEGKEEIIFPWGNKAEYDQLSPEERSGITAHFLTDLEAVASFSGIRPPTAIYKEVKDKGRRQKGERPIDYLIHCKKHWFSDFIILPFLIIMSLFTKNFIIALYFKSGLSVNFYYILQAFSLILIGGGIISALILVIRSWLMKTLYLFLLYLGVSFTLFITTPYVYDNIDMYNQARYIIQSEYLRGYFSQIPNYPVLNFQDKITKGDLGAVLQAAKKIPPDSRDYLQYVFVPLVNFLSTKNYQEIDEIFQAIENFLAAVERFHDVQELEKSISTGLDVAELAARRYDNRELGRKIAKIRKRGDISFHP